MEDYFVQAVAQYTETTGTARKDLRHVATPFIDENNLSDDCFEEQGELAPHASSLLMKVLYGARYARGDLIRPTQLLARRVTKWRKIGDMRIHRLF